MKHLGDITKISGSEVPIVDIVVGGSPCQDLSCAGKRAGLSGERSGLFMEQIRIVKEMRNECLRQLRMRGADDDIRLLKPRFLVWENVTGALSSPGKGHTGEDFQAVLTEIVRIVKPDAADVPLPDKGKWSKSGCLMGIGENGEPFSVAYRVHDAQFWGKTIRDIDSGDVLALGTPQRRRRIALVADFGGTSAPEILFERESLSGDIEESGETGQGIAHSIKKGSDKTSGRMNPWDVQSKSIFSEESICDSLCSGTTEGMNIQPCVFQTTYGISSYDKGCGEREGMEREVFCVGNGQLAQARLSKTVGTLNCMHDQQAVLTFPTFSQDAYDRYTEAETSSTIKQSGGNLGGGSEALVIQ